MVRRICLLAGLALLASLPAQAQLFGDKIDISAGYSYMRFRSTPQANLNGFEFSGQYRLFHWLGGVADISKEFGPIGGVSSSVTTYLFGAQASHSIGRFTPFVRAMGGHAGFWGGGFGAGALALDGGFGVDMRWKHGFSWRLFEADYVRTRFRSDTQGNVRGSVGIVYRF
jgi:hypothetical protein